MPNDAIGTAELDKTVQQVTKLPRVPGPGRTVRKFKIHHQDDIRAKIKTDHLIERLNHHIDGKIELQPTQIAACKILLDRVVPVLSAVEQTRVDVLPPETELIATIQRLIASNPALIAALGQHAPLIGSSSTIDATLAAQQSSQDDSNNVA